MLRLKLALNAVSSQASFFKRLASMNKEYQGIDLPLSEGTGVLTVETTSDSFEASIRTNSGDELKSFNAYYIEDDEYGDPLYDVYINGESEENQDEASVEYAFSDWMTTLRRELGIYSEEDERYFMETGGISEQEALRAYVAHYEDVPQKELNSIPKEPITRFVKKILIPGIEDYLREFTMPELAKGLRFKVINSRNHLYLSTEGTIFGIPFTVKRSLTGDLFKALFMYHHEPESIDVRAIKDYAYRLGIAAADVVRDHLQSLFPFWKLEMEHSYPVPYNSGFLHEGRIQVSIASLEQDATQELYESIDHSVPFACLRDVDTFLNLLSSSGTIRDELLSVTEDLKIKSINIYCTTDRGEDLIGFGQIEIQPTA